MKSTIAEDKVRTIITIEKTDKEMLEKLAKEDCRSFNNLINKILKDYIKKSSKK